MSRNFTHIVAVYTAVLILMSSSAFAITYTATASGNFNAPSTWQGGVAPAYNLANDVIIIPATLTVTLTNDLVMGGGTGSLNVNGTLNGSGFAITVSNLQFTGTGQVNVDSFAGGASVFGTFDFGGTLDTRILNTAFLTCSNSPAITVREKLYVTDTINMTSGVMTIGSVLNGEIIINNPGSTAAGPFLLSGGTGSYNLNKAYDVSYSGGNTFVGIELTGMGLNTADVNLGATNELLLSANLDLNTGTLILSQGNLNLNNYDLAISGGGDIAPTGTGSIKSTSASDITVNKDISGELRFTQGATVGVLNVNVTNSLLLGTALKVATEVNLQSGKIDLQSSNLSLTTGATVKNADKDKYIVTSAGGSLKADIAPNGSTVYHVGTADNYTPCTISANTNTAYNGIGVSVENEVRAAGPTGKSLSAGQPVVKATWYLTGSSGNTDVNIKLAWDAAMEVNGFDKQSAYVAQLAGATWKKDTPAPATAEPSGQYSATKENATYFSAVTVFDANTVGIEELDITADIELYPNPANNIIYINTPVAVNAVVYSMQGRLVHTQQLQVGVNNIDISVLPAGTYYFKAGTGTNSYTTKFIKR